MTAARDGHRYGILTGSWPMGLPPDGRFYVDLARRVESGGFDALFSGDHLFMYGPNADPLPLLGVYAGATERLLLGTAVLLPALREPVVLAKQLATIDYISGGRLVVGAGVGGEVGQEWDAMEIPVGQRGARTDEALALMRAFWSGAPLDFHGRFRTVTGVTGSPACATPGGPPIWIGGRSDAALARAARHDGWCAYSSSVNRIRASVAAIVDLRGGDMENYRISLAAFACVDDDRQAARDMTARVLGRRYRQDFSGFLDAFCVVGTPEDAAAAVARFHDAGVDDLFFVPQVPWQRYGEQVDRLAEVVGLSRTEVSA
jgi:alkanesulfonate monooxygenase SsuD/methylene tetrahydromethanopterin reductase-like flavin-dependent oxidoreductase (luciferase family)